MARIPYNPSAAGFFPLSRTKLELFLDCPRCFYLDRCRGIVRPDSARYSLNLAVDLLLKKEFDAYRLDHQPHPVMQLHGIEAVPFAHPQLATWRDTPQGIRVSHQQSRLELFGIVDDVWVAPDGRLHPVDYKATSIGLTPTLDHRDGYRRQLDVYGWILAGNGFALAREGYVLFANADREKPTFDRRLSFTLSIVAHVLDLSWIDDALLCVRDCLDRDIPPPSTSSCVWCAYRQLARTAESEA